VYRPDGKVDHQTRTNGVTTSYGYNGRGMISSVRHRNDAVGADLAFREYWRDERDRITAWKRGTDHSLNGMEDGRGTRYEYDPHDGQLIRAYYRVSYPETDHPTGAVRADIFAYDELGNRKGDQNHVASRGSSMKFNRRNNGLNQYDQWETVPTTWMSRVFYDDNFFYTSEHPYPQWEAPGNGVTMADGYTTACFNALNQPIAIWSMAYAWTSNVMHFGYDPLGRCVKRWVGPSDDPNTTGATFLYYDGWNLIQEGQGGILVDRTYVHGARVDEIVASRINGTWYHHHYDAQGNCILQSNTNGAIQVQYDYDAFGYPYIYNSVGNKGLAQTRFLFTGREWLEDLRLYDYRNRMYQPELGRFLQPDPQEFRAGDYNLYRYCHNDPVNRSDPSGMTDWELKTEFSKDGKYEKVSWNATVKLPTRLGSNIPVFLHIEVTREQTNVANLTDKGGNKAAALTTAESHTSSNHVQWSILVRHNTGGYGPQWQAFSRNREPEHANRILARAQSDGAQIAFARGVLAGNLEARAQGQLDDQMKYEKWLDNQGAHTLKDANGNVVPDEK
jgi:RHS repeat-associated protein